MMSNIFFKVYFNDFAIIVILSFFLPFIPPDQVTPFPPALPPLLLMAMCRTYKFFGFSISYTILNLSLPCLLYTSDAADEDSPV